MRIDKFLANLDIGTRIQVKHYLKQRRICVNGKIVTKPDLHIDENNDVIEFDGSILTYKKYYYYMLNKPAGVVSAVTDENCKTVLDILDTPCKKGLFPVGRLDKDTEGLLIITTDGKLAHKLLSPKKHVSKDYFVRVDKPIEREHIEMFKTGIDIGEKKLTKPAVLNVKDRKDGAIITITEGKYHQIKRMFSSIGMKVLYLKRISMGNLILDEKLGLGEYRELTSEEEACLKAESAELREFNLPSDKCSARMCSDSKK